MHTHEATSHTINLYITTDAQQASTVFNLPDGLPPIETVMPELQARALAELIAVRYRMLGPDPAVRDALDCHQENSRYHVDADTVQLIEKAESAVRSLAQRCREDRWSGMPSPKCDTSFFLDPTAESSLAACLIGVNSAAIVGECITELGRADQREIRRRAGPEENQPLVDLLRMLSSYHHIAPGTETKLAQQGYTVAELLIDRACAFLTERLEVIEGFAGRAYMNDVESAARGALQTAQQARKIVADGVTSRCSTRISPRRTGISHRRA